MAAASSSTSACTPSRAPLRGSRQSSLLLLVVCGCGEGLPAVGLDHAPHDRCSGAPPQNVDASASEIQCRVDDYLLLINDDDGTEMFSEQGTNVSGMPICCEVCAVKGTADDVCESTCKYDLCSRALDSHIAVGQDLDPTNTCLLDGCGFGFQSCMDTDLLHVQAITFPKPSGTFPVFYTMRAECDAHADDVARSDGLFAYLEHLDGIPGARGELANVEDVVAYCLDHRAQQATGTPPPSRTTGSSSDAADGADTTGTGTGTLDTTAGSLDPDLPLAPVPCGPWAMERFWIRPSNNFGTWNDASGGVGGVGATTSMARVTGGGVAYTLFPCNSAPGAACVRIDQLSAELTDIDSGLVIRLGLLENSETMSIGDEGRFAVPAGALRVVVDVSTIHGRERLVMSNDQEVSGHIDTASRSVRIDDLGVSSERGDVLARLSLASELTNVQPSTEIIEARDPSSGSSMLVAETFDPDSDAITHRWMIPGVGSWQGTSISPRLPPGRHAVILYADDVHRARGIDARWIEVMPPASH